MVQHYDWANYGLVTTSDNSASTQATQWDNQKIVPLGSPYTEFASGISGLSTHSTTTNDLTEAITNAYELYLRNGATADDTDDDGEGLPRTGTRQPSILLSNHPHCCPHQKSTTMMVHQV